MLSFSTVCAGCFFNDLFIHFESQSFRMREYGGDRKIFHMLVHSPDGCRPKIEASSKSHMLVAGTQSPWLSSVAFPGD